MASDLEQTDVAAVLTADHREMERLYDAFKSATDDPDRLQAIVRDLTRLISTHAVAEEQVLYPAMEAALRDGEREVAEARDQHGAIERMLESIEKLESTDAAFAETVDTMMLELIPHAREEEEDVLPALRAAVGDDEMRSLGTKIEGAKRMAPTRPHPLVPNTAPMRTLAGPMAAVADRARDAMEARRRSGRSWRVPTLIGVGLMVLAIGMFVRRRRSSR